MLGFWHNERSQTGAKNITKTKHDNIRQWCIKTALIIGCILEPIGNFIPTTTGEAAARNAAREAAKTAVDGS